MLLSFRMITFVDLIMFRHKNNEERVHEKSYDGLKCELR